MGDDQSDGVRAAEQVKSSSRPVSRTSWNRRPIFSGVGIVAIIGLIIAAYQTGLTAYGAKGGSDGSSKIEEAGLRQRLSDDEKIINELNRRLSTPIETLPLDKKHRYFTQESRLPPNVPTGEAEPHDSLLKSEETKPLLKFEVDYSQSPKRTQFLITNESRESVVLGPVNGIIVQSGVKGDKTLSGGDLTVSPGERTLIFTVNVDDAGTTAARNKISQLYMGICILYWPDRDQLRKKWGRVFLIKYYPDSTIQTPFSYEENRDYVAPPTADTCDIDARIPKEWLVAK